MERELARVAALVRFTLVPAVERVVTCSEALRRRRRLVPAVVAAAAESAVTKPMPAPLMSESPMAHGRIDLFVVPVAYTLIAGKKEGQDKQLELIDKPEASV